MIFIPATENGNGIVPFPHANRVHQRPRQCLRPLGSVCVDNAWNGGQAFFTAKAFDFRRAIVPEMRRKKAKGAFIINDGELSLGPKE